MTRNPCLNPGDLRLLQGVDKPELRHLFNVVVFSSKGERPQCNKMSGGDLDGDVYFVCWDRELISYLSVDQMQDPGNYRKPTTVKEKPPQEGLADYFVFYLSKDILGKIANMHLALADQLGPQGPLDPSCLTLAHLQSIAVDFAKHGESVESSLIFEFEQMMDHWPDFFEKTHQEMRVSTGILGQLYRDISNDEAVANLLTHDYTTAILNDYQLDKRILGQAVNRGQMHAYLAEAYDQIVKPFMFRLRQLMLEMNFGCEAEIFASDLRHKLFDDGPYNVYRSSAPMKNEDAM